MRGLRQMLTLLSAAVALCAAGAAGLAAPAPADDPLLMLPAPDPASAPAMAPDRTTTAPTAAGPNIAPDQRIELDTLKTLLTDPSGTAQTRQRAALLLLTKSYPAAAALARELLSDGSNRDAQLALATVIAQSGRTHSDYVQPLLAMLTGAEPAVRAPAASALAAYREPRVAEEFDRILSDSKVDKATRLVIIGAMQRMLEQQAVETLVRLTGDPDGAVRDAACDSLGNLVNVRAFGRNAQRWQTWWASNRTKPQSVWLADLADNLARLNLELEKENVELRKRLATSVNDLYTATPQTARDALLTTMLKDALAEVRLAAARLAQQRLASAAQQPLAETLRAQIRVTLTDPDAAVRQIGAVLIAGLGDDQAARFLADRLKTEQSADVRQAIYQALGLLPDEGVWELLVAGLAEKEPPVAAAAAAAMARAIEKNGLTEQRRSAAVEAVMGSFPSGTDETSAPLREALLGAMGMLRDKRLAPLLVSALKDPAPTVRLGGIKGLQRLGLPENAAAVSPLAGDSDRGVRLAAIAAVGALGGAEHLEVILARTDARLENDAALRQQAWTVVMDLLAKAEVETLQSLAERLARREDAAEQYIRVLRLWAAKLSAEREQSAVRVRLASALMTASRPAEAATELALVYESASKSPGVDPSKVWLSWVEALLAADDPAAIGKMAEVEDEAAFLSAWQALQNRLETLKPRKEWDSALRLAETATQKLAPRLNESQRKGLETLIREARTQQAAVDRQRVSALVGRLVGTDQAARTEAAKDLTGMKNRAIGPLVLELKTAVKAETPNAAAEKAILEVLSGLAPQLKGYDPKASPAEKAEVLDGWLTQLGS